MVKSTKQAVDLRKRISDSVKDPSILVPSCAVSLKNPKIVEVGGIKIFSSYDVNGYVNLPCFRPNLTPGFFMFVYTNSGKHESSIKRHYIGAHSPEYAINIWSKSVSYLVSAKKQFSAKVLSNTASYPRNDAIVFYSSEDSEDVEKILIEMVHRYNDISKLHGSHLCKKIIKNLYTAEEPLNNIDRQSFGEHRCSAIAEAIQDYFITNVDFRLLLEQRFRAYNIDPCEVSKNLSSN